MGAYAIENSEHPVDMSMLIESEEGKALKEAWGIPEKYQGIGNVILGYAAPGGTKEAPPRKEDYIRRV